MDTINTNTVSLFKISLPLMLSSLSTYLMMLVDRVILVRYDLEAMNSVAAAIMAVSVFDCFVAGVTAMSEVFVGRYNGAKKFAVIGSATWQMIWFSLMSLVVSVPIAFYGAKIFVPQELAFYGEPYFKLVMAFAPLAAVNAALSGFYIGIGHTRYITVSVVVGNIINAMLAIILIFGISGFIPSFGIKGAAVATIVGWLVQCLLLLCGFLNHNSRKIYGTTRWHFNSTVMWQEIKLGVPQAIGHMLEVIAWAFSFHLLAPLGMAFVTVMTVCQSVLLTVYFMLEGLQKGVIGIASNIIGANKIDKIKHLLNSSVRLYTIVLCIIAIPTLIFSKQLISTVFIPDQNDYELIHQVMLGLRWMFLFCVFDGLVWILAGIFTAGGDTKFVMAVNSLNAWLFSIAPLYLVTKVSFIEPHMTSIFTALYAMVNMVFFVVRYRSGRWLRLSEQEK